MKDFSREFLLEVERRREKRLFYTAKTLCLLAILVASIIILFGGPIIIAFLFLLL